MTDYKAPIIFLNIIFGFTVTYLIEKRIIPFLGAKAKQPLYEDGPSWHSIKNGTPTMGGIAFVLAISLSLIFSSMALYALGMKSESLSLIIALSFCFFNSLIGIIDDLTKIKRKENEGLSAKQKILLQLVFAVIFIVLRKVCFDDPTVIALWGFNYDIGVLYYPLCIILLLGIVNCANLTDGIDGLATSVAFAIGTVILFAFGENISVGVISSSFVGATLAFFLFNRNPAKIFMGDTGSLFLGALVVSSAFSSGLPFYAVPLGVVYVVEGISVILQVTIFKLTQKRLFKMAPLHHHLEKTGMKEDQICLCAVIITLLTAIISFIIM